jgi:hypothetical protein
LKPRVLTGKATYTVDENTYVHPIIRDKSSHSDS